MKKGWLKAAKFAAMLLVLALIARSLARNWAAFQSVQVTLDVKIGWLAASVGVIFLTYAIQIESWRRMLHGWDQRLSYPNAARAWTLANLGRYIPGKVWSVAGLVVLAERAGVRRSAAAVSAFAMQGVLAWRRTAQWLGTLADSTTPLPPMPLSAIILSSSLMLLSWATFGVSFWMLIRGLISTAGVPLPAAMGMFALGYVMGLVALVAPGGLGVRDLALVGFLTPLVGSGGALAVSLASRVQLTLTEAGAAGAGLLLKPKAEERPDS